MPSSTARIFAIGDSQAVSLPTEFQFDGVTEVFIRRDEATGDVVLSTRTPADWRTFMQMREQIGVNPADFMHAREQEVQQRSPFKRWKE